MPSHRFWRNRAVAIGVSATAAAATVAGVPPVAHADAMPGTITIATPANGRLAAGTAKQVLMLNVAGATLSEGQVIGVNLGSSPACQSIPTYIITSATTMTVKTPTGGCPVTTAPDGDNIEILFAGGKTLTKTGGLYLVTPPAIAAAADRPVINDNSAMLASANQVTRFLASGGQTVRVRADATYAFDPRGAAALGVTFGGKPGSEVKVFDGATGVQVMPTTDAAPGAGNYLTFKTVAGLSADDAGLTITQNGVSRTFAAADTGVSIMVAPAVASLSVTSGKSRAPTSTVVTGSGFSKTLADYTGDAPTWRVQFCRVRATVTAVNATGTSLTVTTPDVSDNADGLGKGVFAGTCPVTVTDVGTGATSPISGGGYFSFLNE
jgi:hypothetical protein